MDRTSTLNGYAGRFHTVHAGRIMQIMNKYIQVGLMNYTATQGGEHFGVVAAIIPAGLAL